MAPVLRRETGALRNWERKMSAHKKTRKINLTIDGTYVVEFKTAAGEALAISAPAGERPGWSRAPAHGRPGIKVSMGRGPVESDLPMKTS
jgi:hypothetical protein